MASSIIRKAIAAGVFNVPVAHISEQHDGYIEQRWGKGGLSNVVTKTVVSPTLAAGNALVNETIVRDEFIQAVWSGSILGKLQSVMHVPALTRVNVESVPAVAPFVGEYAPIPAFAGNFSFVATDKRKVGIVGVFSKEMLLATGDAAENVISGQVARALSRGVDKGFVGTKVRDAVSPNGLGAVSIQVPAVTAVANGGATFVDTQASFSAGVIAFTGDLSRASVLVNPLTAITLRSPTEQGITAAGGIYGGLPVITSYAVPVGKLFIVDGSRVLAYVGGAFVDVITQGTVVLDDGTGTVTTTATSLFQTGQSALMGQQYVDWEFAPGAAVEITLS